MREQNTRLLTSDCLIFQVRTFLNVAGNECKRHLDKLINQCSDQLNKISIRLSKPSIIRFPII
jgi:hypothetical protein